MKYKQKTLNILVINAGSSSLKYKLIRMPENKEMVSGEVKRVGVKTKERPLAIHSVLGQKREIYIEADDHNQALLSVFRLMEDNYKKDKNFSYDIFAHRYVHPGRYFNRPVKITATVLDKLKETLSLAPLHNPISYGLIESCRKEFPRVAQYAVFDTAFHRTIPNGLAAYALPYKLSRKYHLKKVGFHGLSHRYVMQEGCHFLKRDQKTQRIISCHLGSGGGSVCAIDCGKSINNSMGFTPLEGLVMNTRCGDVDLGIIFYIMFKEKLSLQETEYILNKKSGILGMFQASSDPQELVEQLKNSSFARLALQMYVSRVKKYIGYYSILLKKADMLVFTDSIGVNFPAIREKICQGLNFFGFNIDHKKNKEYKNGIADISKRNSPGKILILPTNEELMIAQETYKRVEK